MSLASLLCPSPVTPPGTGIATTPITRPACPVCRGHGDARERGKIGRRWRTFIVKSVFTSLLSDSSSFDVPAIVPVLFNFNKTATPFVREAANRIHDSLVF